MDSVSQLNRHQQKEVNYGKALTKSRKLSNVALISLCYGNHLALRLREIGLLLSTPRLIVRLTSLKLNRCSSPALLTAPASPRTFSPAGAAALLQPGPNTLKTKPHMFKLQRNNSVFLCLYIRTMCGRGLCFWPSYPAVIYILLLGQHPTMPCFLCIIESPSGILKRGRGLAIKGSRAAYSTRVTSKTL